MAWRLCIGARKAGQFSDPGLWGEEQRFVKVRFEDRIRGEIIHTEVRDTEESILAVKWCSVDAVGEQGRRRWIEV